MGSSFEGGQIVRVLQLGPNNWAKKYKIPDDIEWEFNEFPSKNKKKAKQGYDAVIITGGINFSKEKWTKLQYKVDPYHVCYLEQVVHQMDKAGQYFLKCSAANKITETPQEVINHLITRLYYGQSGIRFMPTQFQPLMNRIDSYQMLDQCHFKIGVDTNDQWVNIGNYRINILIDPQKLMSFWLEMQSKGVKVRLRAFVQGYGTDGDLNDCFVIPIDSDAREHVLPIGAVNYRRVITFSLEVKGEGSFILGILHSRWSRDGYGAFLAGGKRIINPDNLEDIAYYFNPGDLRPPLNVYFSGFRTAEGFEAFPMFRRLHAPMLLFTDMRQEGGQFYTASFMEESIKKEILSVLKHLGFDRSQLVMNGISMGTYGAIKFGTQLGAGFINAAKPLCNLGYISERGHLERPGAFSTIFDVDNRLTSKLDKEHLQKIDQDFWRQFNQLDLSNTRLFIGYMKDDEYDNHSIHQLRRSPAIANAKQFVYRGFPGRHNGNRQVNQWFIERLHEIMRNDFSREI